MQLVERINTLVQMVKLHVNEADAETQQCQYCNPIPYNLKPKQIVSIFMFLLIILFYSILQNLYGALTAFNIF